MLVRRPIRMTPHLRIGKMCRIASTILFLAVASAVLGGATLTNATLFGEQEHLGSIAAGKMADLVLLTANPLDDIRNTRRIELAIHSGLVCRPPDLLKRIPKQ